ncbi:carbohydrate binding domain-containing protein [uncultured Lactobacillus sp.]|uniref:carbohydrate binding domain-containing protein n=1 Tax=uncultured Lactobacillus sp. TaxID=153152 RepID=UPI00260502A6|nr:carbohydrate binding domain-containing protein [uncultured Lactobacillus sp.]
MSIFIDKHELAEKKDIVNPNLLTGSKDFTGNWLYLDQVKQKDKYLDFTAVCSDWAWNGISQFIAVNKGETFTFSAYAKGKAGSSLNLFITLNNDGEGGYKKVNGNPNGITITATGDWQKVSMTFTMLDSGAIQPRIEGNGTVPFWIAGLKLERGAVATPWCPAPEDYVMKSDLDALKAEINQLKQGK